MRHVKHLYSKYKQIIFQNYPNGSRPTDGRFITFLRYPNQFLLSAQTGRYGWSKRKGKSDYFMIFVIKTVEVFRRRNKRKEPCMSEWKKFDEFVMTHTIEKVGCRAPYQTQHRTDLPICTGKQKMVQALVDVRTSITKNFNPPCVVMTDIQDSYNEVDAFLLGKGDWFWTMIEFPNQLRHIKQSKEITFHTLVGNSGGYIGLFLGEYCYLILLNLLCHLILL